ncbi:hypothetical protein FI667_g3058, partial [Globisporangium splendens]
MAKKTGISIRSYAATMACRSPLAGIGASALQMEVEESERATVQTTLDSRPANTKRKYEGYQNEFLDCCKFSSKYSSLLPPSKSGDRFLWHKRHFERSFQRPSEVKRFDDAALSTSSIPVQDPASILVRNMDATGTPLGPAVPETVELTIEGFPHLSSHEWVALERMRDVIGEAAVVSLLRSASPEDQKSAVVSFMHHV